MSVLDRMLNNKKDTNNVFFKGVLVHSDSEYVLNEDAEFIAKYKNFLNSYLSGAEFPVVIDTILSMLDVNVSNCYIIGNIIYAEKDENGIWQDSVIDPNLTPDWINEYPRWGHIGFRFSDGYSFDPYYAIQISSIQGGVKLYKGSEGRETLINSYTIDCNIRSNLPRINSLSRYNEDIIKRIIVKK